MQTHIHTYICTCALSNCLPNQCNGCCCSWLSACNRTTNRLLWSPADIKTQLHAYVCRCVYKNAYKSINIYRCSHTYVCVFTYASTILQNTGWVACEKPFLCVTMYVHVEVVCMYVWPLKCGILLRIAVATPEWVTNGR